MPQATININAPITVLRTDEIVNFLKLTYIADSDIPVNILIVEEARRI